MGRKTANVVRSVAFGLPGLPVDTHVIRLSGLLGLTTETDPVRIETEVCALMPQTEWGTLSLRLILHGRRVCVARTPRCDDCVLADFCPSSRIPTRRQLPNRRAGRRPEPARQRRERDVVSTSRARRRAALPRLRSTSNRSADSASRSSRLSASPMPLMRVISSSRTVADELSSACALIGRPALPG